MPYNRYITKRPSEPKKSQAELKKERIAKLLDTVHGSPTKELSLPILQQILGWGDGVFERIVRIVKECFTHEVEYVKKGRKFVSLLKESPADKE